MKPWGPLQWLLKKLPTSRLHVIGCLGAEQRSVAVPRTLRHEGATVDAILRIRDAPSNFLARVEAKTDTNAEVLHRADIQVEKRLNLLAEDGEIAEAFTASLEQADGERALVIDISCMPKRFFFLMLKLALRDKRVQTLFVTYTQPQSGMYTYDHLAENPAAVGPIPGYSPTGREPDVLVVGLGFEPLGLRQLVDEYRDRKRRIEVLIPFPPGQPYTRRIWKALQRLEVGELPRRVHRVNAVDAFGTYASIARLVAKKAGAMPPALAPYGPKPMSLGMCLYAIKEKAPVFYTQPMVYHPDYTVGIGRSWGYCLKYEKRRFF